MRKLDLISVIAIVVMTLCLAVACFYIYEHKYDTCNSNPLTYAAQYYGNQAGYNMVGYIWFELPNNFKPERFYFNSTGIYETEYLNIINSIE